MLFYMYGGCDPESPESTKLSGPEAFDTQFHRSLIILVDEEEDEDDEVEGPPHPPPSQRPKRPLPKSFGRGRRSQVKEGTVQGTEAPRSEVYHTISCTPGLRDVSLEVRLFPSR